MVTFPEATLQALEHSSIDAYIATDKGEKTHKNPLDGSEQSWSRPTLNTTKLITSLSVPKDRS